MFRTFTNNKPIGYKCLAEKKVGLTTFNCKRINKSKTPEL